MGSMKAWVAVLVATGIELWPELQRSLADGKLTEDEIEKLMTTAAKAAVIAVAGRGV